MANVKKYRCMNVGNCTTANENKTFEIADGADLVCPDCKKDMIVEVKGGGNGGLIGGIVGGVVVAGLAACWGLGVFSGSSEPAETPVDSVATPPVEVVEVVETPDTAAAAPIDSAAAPAGQSDQSDKSDKSDPSDPSDPSDKAAKAAQAATSLSGYALPYGTYSGPASNGKPNGLNGEVSVTKSFALDLQNGQSLQLSKGDKIIRCKFVNGQLVSGMLKRPDGTSKDINIGV